MSRVLVLRPGADGDFLGKLAGPAGVPAEVSRFFGRCRIHRVEVDLAGRSCQVFLRAKEDLDSSCLRWLEESLARQFGGRIVARFELLPTPAAGDLGAALREAWPSVVEEALRRLPSANGWLTRAQWRLGEDRSLTVTLESPEACAVLRMRNLSRALEEILEEQCGFEGRVTLASAEEAGEHAAEIRRAQDEEERSRLEAILAESTGSPGSTGGAGSAGGDAAAGPAAAGRGGKPAVENGRGASSRGARSGDPTVLHGKAFTGAVTLVSEIQDEENKVIVEGEVLTFETRDLKTGRRIVIFDLTDYSDSITVKLFREKDAPDLSEQLAPGAWVKVRGPVQYDRFTQELTLMADAVMLGAKPRRIDDAQEKRVELHLHTTMSSMDACMEAAAAVKRAAEWGHPAVAITDHGAVQAFPFAYDVASKKGIKVIYGLEAYLIDDGAPIVIRPRDAALGEETFVVVDLETTGVTPSLDEIIEIGAVKVRGGQKGETFHSFIKPSRPISAKIRELTGISDEMVSDAPPPAVVLKRWLEFCGDGTLVAHNASFDSGFLRWHLEKLFGHKLDNPILDTLWLSRALLPGLKSHNLESTTKALGIKLQNHHRALDDAVTAADILLNLLDRLGGRDDLRTVSDLNRLTREISLENVRPTHATILIKTQAGVKNLYRLVSHAHLDYFYRTPRIPRTLLIQNREGLLVGSACEAGEVYQAILRGASQEELAEKASFYDYLEIMPAANNEFMIREGIVGSAQDLHEVNRRIYQLGKKLGKPVVATGDAHYLDPSDDVYRRILKAGQGYSEDHEAQLHFRTTGEMLEEFSYLGPEAAREVVVIAPRAIAGSIESVQPVPDGLFAPEIPGAEYEIREMSYRRAKELYGDPLPEIVQKRLDRELNAIIGNGYSVVYLIAHKLVKKSLDDGYLVGSRGSVGSSLVATMCNITEVNPLAPHYLCPACRHSEFILDGSAGSGFDLPDRDCPKCGHHLRKEGQDIPFETFMGFEGDKVPDIDLNFSGFYQSKVHKYTEELFGTDYVYRAGTIATVAERTAYGYVKAFLESQKRIVRKAEMNRLARGCTGVKRTTGQHPGGLMVVPKGKEMIDFCPVQHPADDRNSDTRTTHFDYHSIEGRLLKLDLLGHDDPTVLRLLQDLTGIDVKSVPFDDLATQSLFRELGALGVKAEDIGTDLGTLGVPEFGTRFVRQMLAETKPKTFSELIRISGLSHGTDVWTNNAQDLVKDKKATLSGVIACRDDIMIYLMYQGVEPSNAFKIMEKVRKGKGLAPEDEAVMRAANVPEWYIESCRKIKYLFPKAHAAAYVMMGFRIAWFKVHHPLAFYATYFTVRADQFDAQLVIQGPEVIRKTIGEIESRGNTATAKDKNLQTLLEVALEMYARGFRFERVSLGDSGAQNFKIVGNALLPPFAGLQGVGDTAAANIVAARVEAPFSSVEDLRVRAKLSKTVIEVLSAHGALEGLPQTNQLALF